MADLDGGFCRADPNLACTSSSFSSSPPSSSLSPCLHPEGNFFPFFLCLFFISPPLPFSLPCLAMNSLHDHNHKRTSITELLNPIAATPASSIDSYTNSTQLPSLHAQYLSSSQSHHNSQPSAYAPQQIGSGSSFSLRAASWDHGTKDDLAVRRPESDPSACRYTSTVQSHPLYPEPVTRVPRPMDEQPNYGIEVGLWPPSHDTTNVSYAPGPQMIAPVYSEERTGKRRFLSLGCLCPLSAVVDAKAFIKWHQSQRLHLFLTHRFNNCRLQSASTTL